MQTLLQNIKQDYDLWVQKYNKMQDYYDGKTDAMLLYQMVTERSNSKINCNYIQKFVIEEASFVCGNKILYTSNSNNSTVVEDIRLNTKHWSEKHDKELTKQALIFNSAYELYYINNDGLFTSMITTPQNSYAYTNDFGNIEVFCRFFKKKFDLVTEYCDVYDKDNVTHYIVSGTSFKQIGITEPNIFSKVPVSVISLGSIEESLYGILKGLQDSYETIISDSSNLICDFRNAYLTFTGCSLEETDLIKMKQLGIIQLPTTDSKAAWLTKDINDSFIQNSLNTIQEDIYMLSCHINHNEKLASNTSSLAMRNRLLGLQNKCANITQAVQDCIKSRLSFLFEYLNIKFASNYDYRDIEIKLTLNIPSDDLMLAQILAQYPEISAKTGLSQFSFISNVDNEIAQKKLENKANSIGNTLLNGGGVVAQ